MEAKLSESGGYIIIFFTKEEFKNFPMENHENWSYDIIYNQENGESTVINENEELEQPHDLTVELLIDEVE